MKANTKFSAVIAASLLMALPLAVGTASAETIKTDSKQTIVLDATPTGSIQRAERVRDCDPNSSKADAICKITGGNPDTKFPSAPISIFGF